MILSSEEFSNGGFGRLQGFGVFALPIRFPLISAQRVHCVLDPSGVEDINDVFDNDVDRILDGDGLGLQDAMGIVSKL